jgi:PTH1 family peptidyl-tRNA hydrolase
VKVIVGLGNPGREYAATRHNIGFMVVDRLAKRLNAPVSKARFRAQISEAVSNGEKTVLVEPQTYMNLSGHSVREVLNWYKCPPEDLIVVADDLDLAFGTLRLRARGSAGGHNGLASIFEQLGTQETARLKIGIGRGPGAVIARVLSRFSPEEEAALPDLIERAADAVLLWQSHGIIAAMNAVNGVAKTAVAPAKEAAES